MLRELWVLVAAGFMAILAVSCDGAALPLKVRSPDGQNSIELTLLGEQTNKLAFKISRGSRPLIAITSFTVRLAEGGELSGVATLENAERGKVDEQFSLPWGNTKE